MGYNSYAYLMYGMPISNKIRDEYEGSLDEDAEDYGLDIGYSGDGRVDMPVEMIGRIILKDGKALTPNQFEGKVSSVETDEIENLVAEFCEEKGIDCKDCKFYLGTYTC